MWCTGISIAMIWLWEQKMVFPPDEMWGAFVMNSLCCQNSPQKATVQRVEITEPTWIFGKVISKRIYFWRKLRFFLTINLLPARFWGSRWVSENLFHLIVSYLTVQWKHMGIYVVFAALAIAGGVWNFVHFKLTGICGVLGDKWLKEDWASYYFIKRPSLMINFTGWYLDIFRHQFPS